MADQVRARLPWETEEAYQAYLEAQHAAAGKESIEAGDSDAMKEYKAGRKRERENTYNMRYNAGRTPEQIAKKKQDAEDEERARKYGVVSDYRSAVGSAKRYA